MVAKVSLPASVEARPSPGSATWIDAEVHKAQVDILFRTAPAAVVAAVMSAMALIVGLRVLFAIDLRLVAIWVALHLVTFAFAELVPLLYWLAPAPTRNWRLFARLFVLASFLGGLGWGLGSLVLLSQANLEQELLIVLVISGLASGTVLALGSYLRATFAHFIPLTAPLLVWAVSRNDQIHVFLCALAVFYIAGISILAKAYCANLTSSLRLEIENRGLVEQLSREKETAEKANIAKSRFLASASHDLRQPVHALSMFVGALMDKPLAPDSHHLVEQISGAVETMDGLFQSLLDISKLDAGVVHSRMQALRLWPLLDRIRAEFQSQAQSKGLTIGVCSSSAVVWTDPVLLENILRNLVSNAVRYTHRGRILIGCRRGERLRIEVLDTGIGIAPENLGKIFEEFYQVGNGERDRSRGLGLGLAIVKRTAALIQCDIEMESELGRGTQVKLFVPMAPSRTSPSPPVGARRLTAAKPGLIFVVDDDRTIREAMGSLLRGWGHTVVVAETGDEILRQAANRPQLPDLFICDYRLRNNENGIELMQRLQSEYNSDIPGILLTGDTAASRLAEAQASGFLVLHKPVSSARLQAALRVVMAQAAPSPEPADAAVASDAKPGG